MPVKAQVTTANHIEFQRCETSGPLHTIPMVEVLRRLEITTQRPVAY